MVSRSPAVAWWLPSVALAAAVALVSSCGPRCGADQAEVDGACVDRCNADAECGRGKVCTEGVCVADNSASSSSGGASSSSGASSTSSSSSSSSSGATSGVSSSAGGSSAGMTSFSAATSGAVMSSSGGASSTATTASSALPALVITPTAATARLGTPVVFQASGGVPPYTFTLTGPGMLDVDGTYRRAWVSGDALVNVEDTAFQVATAGVNVPPDALVVGGPALETGWDVKGLPDGSVLVCGVTAGSVGGQAPLGGTDYVLARFDPYGQRTWLVQGGGTGDDVAVAMLVRGDRVAVTGHTTGTITSNPVGTQGTGPVWLVEHRLDDGTPLGNAQQLGPVGTTYVLGASLVTGNMAGMGTTQDICLVGTTNTGTMDPNYDQYAVVLRPQPETSDAPWPVVMTHTWGTPAYDAATGCAEGFTRPRFWVGGYTGGTMGPANHGQIDATLTEFEPGTTGTRRLFQLGDLGNDRVFNLQRAPSTMTAEGLVLVGYSDSANVYGAQRHGTATDCMALMVEGSTGMVTRALLLGSTGPEQCYAAAVGNQGGGGGSTRFVVGGTATVGMGATASSETYIAAFSPTGNITWEARFSNDARSGDGLNGLALAADGDVLAVGDTTGAWAGRSSPGVQDMVVFKVGVMDGARR